MSNYRSDRNTILALTLVLLTVTTTSSGQTDIDFQALLAQANAKTAAKDWLEAGKAWESVVHLNPVDGRMWRQLAVAHFSAKEYKKAISAFEKVYELGGDVPANSLYNIATCYSLLGEKEQALTWLERSFTEGYALLERAQTDDNFKALRDDARYQKIVGLADTTKMSREEGWRFDLALLAREVKRKGYNRVPRKFSAAEFESEIKRISEAVPKLSDMQISIEMMKLIVKLGDGHSAMQGSRVRPEFFLSVPVKFYLFQEGLFITAADPKYKDLLGAQILKYGDRSFDELMKGLDPFISRDNGMQPKEFAPTLMRYLALSHGIGLIPDAKRVSLRVRDASGMERIAELTVDDTAPEIGAALPVNWITYPQTLGTPVPLYLRNPDSANWFEYLPDSKTLYFQYRSVTNGRNEPLAAVFDRLFKTLDENPVEKLVIDMRFNNGGNTFLNQPLLLGLLRNQKINQRGRLFVIIGRRTFSAAQNSSTFIERFTNAIFVGEPSGSSPNFIGEETPFTLPYSKIIVNISNLYWASSSPLDFRTWIAPTLYTPPTFEAYKANRDQAMEAVLAYQIKP